MFLYHLGQITEIHFIQGLKPKNDLMPELVQIAAARLLTNTERQDVLKNAVRIKFIIIMIP